MMKKLYRPALCVLALSLCVTSVPLGHAMQPTCHATTRSYPKAKLSSAQFKKALKSAVPAKKLTKTDEKKVRDYLLLVMPYGSLRTITWSGSTMQAPSAYSRLQAGSIADTSKPVVTVENDVLTIKATGFNFDIKAFQNELQSVLDSSVPYAVVLDLRGNKGGYLDTTLDFMGFFAEEFAEIQFDYEWQADCVLRGTTKNIASEDLNVVFPFLVLVDRTTAGAAEAAVDLALAENATVIGEPTAGDDKVEYYRPFTPDKKLAGAYTITIGKFRTKGFPITPKFVLDPTDATAVQKQIKSSLTKARPVSH